MSERLPDLVLLDGRAINLKHITFLVFDIDEDGRAYRADITFLNGETITVFRGRTEVGRAEFDALLRFYNSIPLIQDAIK